MHIKIRRAIKEDCQAMLTLIKELAVYENAPDEVTVNFDHFVESGFGANPVYWAFVAEVNNLVVGFALYYIRYSTWKGKRLYLEDIVITESMRGNGLGKTLFDAVVQAAKESNCTGMMWQVLDWNTSAVGFYRKYGTRFDDEWLNCNLDF